MSLHRLIFFKECGSLHLRSFISLRPFVSFTLSVAYNLNHYRATFILGFGSGFAFNLKHQGKVLWIKILTPSLSFSCKYFSLTQLKKAVPLLPKVSLLMFVPQPFFQYNKIIVPLFAAQIFYLITLKIGR